MYKDLQHLSTEELDNLMKRYYSNESVNLLVKEYDLDIRPNSLYKYFPPELVENELCEYCGINLVKHRKSKSNMNFSNENKNEYYCPKCEHRPYFIKCDCSNCIDSMYRKVNDKKSKIQEVYGHCQEQINLDELNFREKIYVAIVCSKLLKEDMYHFIPFCEYEGKLTPDINMDYDIFRELFKKKVLRVSPISSISAFKDYEEFPNVFYIDKVTFYLNIEYQSSKSETFEKVLNVNYTFKKNFDEIINLWREIGVAECKEYLLYVLNKVGFDFSPGEKTQKVFEMLLNDFSVSQIFGIIKRQVDSVSSLFLEKGLNRKHAANMVIGNCERFAERAKSEGWSLTQYNRPYELQQSDLSFFFFYNVLKIGDKGFRMSIKEFGDTCTSKA